MRRHQDFLSFLYQGQVVAQFFLKTGSRFVVTIATRPWRVNETRARLDNSRVWMVKLDASNVEIAKVIGICF